ncbi:MAG: hypothetical protein HKM28_04335, partial [Flavobacteriaceae bacterium]|nr:hypothetical protein [Flavobacteriaceae bacterium]
ILIRGKLGYSSSNFEVYDRSEKITIGISAFSFGDDRRRLNPELNGSIFGRIEAIYRFQLTHDSAQQ